MLHSGKLCGQQFSAATKEHRSQNTPVHCGQRGDVEKMPPLRLHIVGRDVWLLDPGCLNATLCSISLPQSGDEKMKKVFALAALAVLLASANGCSSCRSSGWGWFNRGDNCGPPPCAPSGCATSGWQQRNYVPGAQPMVLPGPIEVAPLQ
jgi:hypothetical protein